MSASDGIGSEDSSDVSSSSDDTNSDSEREHIINDGLETITEEDRVTSSVQSTEGQRFIDPNNTFIVNIFLPT